MPFCDTCCCCRPRKDVHRKCSKSETTFPAYDWPWSTPVSVRPCMQLHPKEGSAPAGTRVRQMEAAPSSSGLGVENAIKSDKPTRPSALPDPALPPSPLSTHDNLSDKKNFHTPHVRRWYRRGRMRICDLIPFVAMSSETRTTFNRRPLGLLFSSRRCVIASPFLSSSTTPHVRSRGSLGGIHTSNKV
ncbi:hypothetical protein BCV70DRAFT_57469 [Testicularia cyperi]|uniref:Uncharacterized protein n=1 Tax=Testicularia cyperi TaxID=1882483 RepID=A0A317XVK5_9BASI|nr:hypothetical protein BCV70DRAFT_57469 [Testicularia cyperi]